MLSGVIGGIRRQKQLAHLARAFADGREINGAICKRPFVFVTTCVGIV